MSNRVVEFIKKHPYATAASVGGILLVWLYIRSQNQGSSGTPDDQSFLDAQAADVQAASQFQIAQLQAQQATTQSNNEAAVANNQVTAQEVIAQLQSQDTLAGIAAQAQVQTNADTLSAQTTQAVSLLQAQVAENQNATQAQIAQINATAYVNIADAPYSASEAIAADQTQVALAQVAANEAAIAAANQTPDNSGLIDSINGFAAAHPTSPFEAELAGTEQEYTEGITYAGTGVAHPIPSPAPAPQQQIQQITG